MIVRWRNLCRLLVNVVATVDEHALNREASIICEISRAIGLYIIIVNSGASCFSYQEGDNEAINPHRKNKNQRKSSSLHSMAGSKRMAVVGVPPSVNMVFLCIFFMVSWYLLVQIQAYSNDLFQYIFLWYLLSSFIVPASILPSCCIFAHETTCSRSFPRCSILERHLELHASFLWRHRWRASK